MPPKEIDEKAASAELANLIALPEDKLVEQLGIRQKAIRKEPNLEDEIALRATYDAAAMGPLDGVKALGREILIRWVKEIQKLICGGDSTDAEDRKKLRDAFGVGKTTGALLLTSGLVAIGCPIAIAPVVAAIVMTRFVGSAVEVFCDKSKVWVDSLA